MKNAIDETELARLVAKACRRPKPTTFDELRNAVPALVAEVRRLRAELDAYIDEDQTKVITLQRKIMDVLRDKVEAWEWLDEVDHLYDDAVWLFELRQCAIDELYATLIAAREAVC